MSARLNPADQFTLAIDHEIRKSGLAGNFCGIVLELDGTADENDIARRCREFPAKFARSTARLQQHGRQYEWSLTANQSLPFHLHNLHSPEIDEMETEQVLNHILNKSVSPFEAPPFEIYLVKTPNKSHLILRWFHPACDAKGAELIIHHLFQDNTAEQGPGDSPIDQLLARWSLWKKIKLIIKARQQILQLDRYSTILPVATPVAPDKLKVRLARFDEEQSEKILEQARRHTGLTGTSLYFIGCMMRAMEQAGCSKGDAYCVPYAMNIRKRKSLYPVFGNQVSFLFAQADKDIVKSRERLFSHLREHNKTGIKQGLDHAMLALMQVARWLTLERHGEIVRNRPDGRERSSFWFSFTGGMDPDPVSIAGCPITGMYQFSQLTAPPSLGLLVNNYQDRIVLSYNYIQNQFTPAWIDDLMQRMSLELLGDERRL